MRRITVIAMLGALVLSGCTTVIEKKVASPSGQLLDLPQKIAKRVIEPVLGFAVEDANATITYINNHPTMTDEQKAAARVCPDAIISVAELRNLLDVSATSVEGERKGVIYLATKRAIDGDPRERLREQATIVAEKCIGLLMSNSDVLPFMR